VSNTDHLAIPLVGFLDRIGIDFLYRYGRDSRITLVRVIFAIQLSFVGRSLRSLHAEGINCHFVGVRHAIFRRSGQLIRLPLPGNFVGRLRVAASHHATRNITDAGFGELAIGFFTIDDVLKFNR
jgi:hypothetical protein